MSLRNYLLLMLLATAACYLAFLAVIFFFDPQLGGPLVLILFYFSLLLALAGTFAIAGLLLRLFLTKSPLVFKMVIISFRQGIWLALLAIISLYLKSAQILSWKNLLPLTLGFILLELFFISYKSKQSLNI